MRRPTFAFNAVQSPRRSGKTRRFNVGNHDGAIISDSSGKQCSSSSEGTSSNYETKGNLIGECNSSPTLGSLSTSTPQKPEGDIHNAKNQFRRAANVCGNDVQLVSTPLPYSTTGDCQKPRKRKERLDSSSSITQERKLVRSNSEERPPEEKSEIRRVVSHEDFLPLHVHNARLANQYAHNDNIHKVASSETPKKFNRTANEIISHGEFMKKYNKSDRSPARSRLDDYSQRTRLSPDSCASYCEDADHEGRRHTERFSRARIPQASSRKVSNGNRIRRAQQRCSRQTSAQSQDENENIKPMCSTQAQQNFETVIVENKHAPFPWSEPCDFRPMPSFHAENFISKKCINDYSADQNSSVTCKLRKADDSEDVVRMTECHARKYEHHTKALSENNSVSAKTEKAEFTDTLCLTLPEERLKQISRKLAGIKKRIAKYEETYETQNGYRMSQADKMGDRVLKKLYSEIQKLRKEKLRLKIDPITLTSYGKVVSSNESLKTDDDNNYSKLKEIKTTLADIEKRLQDKRDKSNRPLDLEQMTPEQLGDEKVAMQKALLFLEAKYGRPTTREERDLAHPLYDRYRQVKRLMLRTHMTKLNSSINELETILEHETMDFIPSDSSQPSIASLQLNSERCNLQLSSSTHDVSPLITRSDIFNSDKLKSPSRSVDESPPSSINSTDSNSTSTSSVNENFHNLPLVELKLQLTATQEEKKELRRSIKEYEHNFEMKTGKKMQKEDRANMETTYSLYKQVKAKLRLLEALVNKQKPK